LTDSNKIISKIPTDLDTAGQKQFFNVRKTSIKNLDAQLKIAQSFHCSIECQNLEKVGIPK
jgi:hypothetical protein